ncbi:ABC transporter substrate-binding protein [Brenneria roseae subsp. americana]|uniref:ABC transporter substrate-binding protein n=1 Tax=Brenneria roseae subsp. americana TaxID=1508507 RepID=A0A2U1TXI3_9GAMM|nr:tripartite tricarboxylate transporter substrate binding protein [Brenneria roseae]PWC14111.1 ABC transporter substrate-binding protein [Brenneria roseae subsp. americana]
MKTRNILPHALAGLLAASSLLSAVPALAADYPVRQIEMIVPYSAGGGTDLVARSFADVAKEYLPKAIGIVNKPGGGGAVGFSELVAARPDGYKIGLGTAEITMLPHMGLVNFNADDFAAIALLNADPGAITVKIDAPWNTFAEFMEYAKANPGKIRIGNSGSGAIWHLAAEALGDKTGTKFNNIPYDGAAPAITALLGGHIEAVSVSAAEVSTHVAAGTVKILGVMADERLAAFKDVPTLKENGVDLSIGTWRGILVPKKTPQDVQDVLAETARKVAENPRFAESLSRINLNFDYRNAEEFQQLIERDNRYFKELMTKVGLAQ